VICILVQRDECAVCGGWVHAVQRGGYESPIGLICHPEELEDAEEIASWGQRSDWCPSCGYDNHEHAPDCAAVAGSATPTGDDDG
jgi:hypothetical protein